MELCISDRNFRVNPTIIFSEKNFQTPTPSFTSSDKKIIKKYNYSTYNSAKKIQISASCCAIPRMCIAIFPAIFLPFIDKNHYFDQKLLLWPKTDRLAACTVRSAFSEDLVVWSNCLPISAI